MNTSCLSFIKGAKETAYAALKTACAAANVIYWIDHYDDSGDGAFIRQTIKLNADGFYESWWAKLFVRDVNKTVFVKKIGVFSKDFDAKRAIEEQVTLLEQENWVYLDDESKPIVDVRAQIDVVLKEARPLVMVKPCDIEDLIGGGYIKAQKIVSGLRCFVVMDPLGNVWVKPSCDNGGLPWEPAGSAIVNRLALFKNVDGTRGAALEVVICGAKVNVIDVLFLHDTWVHLEQSETRHTALLNYITGNKLGCEFHLPARVSANAVTNVIFGDVKGVIIEYGNIRYVLSKNSKKVHFCGAWNKKYNAQDDKTLEHIGELDGRYLPDLSYLTVTCAGVGLEAFMF